MHLVCAQTESTAKRWLIVRQRGGRARRGARRHPLRRRLSDHAGDRNPRMAGAQSAKVGGVLLQAEDELASINMIIGASYGGTPALTATSGPGPVADDRGARARDRRGNSDRRHRRDARRTVDRHPDQVRAERPQHRRLRHARRCAASRAGAAVGRRLRVHRRNGPTYLAEALQAPAIVLSDQFIGQARAAIERPADVAFIGAAAARERNRRAYQALCARRRTAFRRWRFRERAAANTRPTASPTRSAAFRPAAPPTIARNSTSGATSWRASTTATTGRRSKATASWP